MKKRQTLRCIIVTLCFLGTIQAQTPPPGLRGAEFRGWLQENFYTGQHDALGYRAARRAMYNFIDNQDNAVIGVYGGFRRPLPFGGSVSNPGPINAEHTIPQSFFERGEPMRSDLHHLFPTYNRWNSTRQNYPFHEIPDEETTKWMVLDRSQATIPQTDIDSYSEYANRSFEPREDHKGNVARAVFYFYTMYPDFEMSRVGSIHTFYAWHIADPVDDREGQRNGDIEDHQENRNPFVDHPEWVLRAWPSIRIDQARDVLEEMGLDIPLVLPDVAALEMHKPIDEIRVHSLNVGAGSCHIIECPGNTSPIIYDCGRLGRSDPDMTQDEVVNYVDSILERYPDDPIVIISHADQDHYRYIPAIMHDRRARTVWFGGRRSAYPSPINTWLRSQEQSGVPVVGGLNRLPPGFSNNGNPVPQLQCGDASTFILTVNEGNTKNSRSLVARIEYADFSVTLTGDATRETQRDAVDNFQDIQTTVLTGSHHGAITHGSNNQSWANAVQPSITVFSSGTSFRHPRCRAVELYHPTLMTVSAHEVWCGEQDGYRAPFCTELAQYVTRINGTVVISSDGENDHRIECTLTSDCGF